MSSPNNFLLNTEYPIDKIVYMNEGSWTPTSFDPETGMATGFQEYETGINATNFVCGEWSEDDFATSFPIGTLVNGGYYQQTPESLAYGVAKGVEAYCGFGGLRIGCQNYASKTLRYRFYVLISEADWEAECEKTAGLSNRLVLDTRENYPKLFEDRIIRLTEGQTFTVNHNLGFRPFVRAWAGWGEDDPKTALYMPIGRMQKIDSQQIVFQTPIDAWLYYRIYADEI